MMKSRDSDKPPNVSERLIPHEETEQSRNFIVRFGEFGEILLLRCLFLVTSLIQKALPRRWNGFGERLEKISRSLAVKNILLLLFYNGFGAALRIMTLLLIINGLGRDRYGEYAYFLALGAYGRSLVRFGRDKTMVRDIIQNPPEQFGRIVGTTFNLSLFLGVLYLIGLGLFGLFTGMNLTHNLWLVVIGAMLPSFDLQPVYDSWREMGKHGSYSFFRNAFSLVIIWSTYLFAPGLFTIETIALTILLSLVITQYLEYREVLLRSHITLLSRSNFFGIFRQFYENFSLGFASLLFIFMGPTIQIILTHYRGRSEVGIYAACLPILTIVNFLYDQILRVASPMLAQVTIPGRSVAAKRRAVFKSLAVMSIPAMLSTIPMILFPHVTVSLLLKPEYAEAATILPVLGTYQLVLAFGVVTARYVQCARYDRLYFLGVSFGAASSVILGVILISKYGAIGAAWTLLLAHGSSIFIYSIITAYDLFRR